MYEYTDSLQIGVAAGAAMPAVTRNIYEQKWELPAKLISLY